MGYPLSVKNDNEPHSAAVLTDWRDAWWSRDFLALTARRLGLAQIRTVVDVGCGKGHWGRLLLPFLAADAALTGVDREAAWVDEARSVAASRGLERLTYRQGTAEALPLPDGCADLVTAQTVLMHVSSATVALREMLRVLRPGGLLLLSEPSNVTMSALTDSVTQGYAPDRRGRRVELHAALRAGRVALGEGDESIGDRLPQLLADAGLHDIRAVLNERVNSITAPNQPTDAEKMGPFAALVRERGWRYDRAEALRLYTASGADPDRFALLFREFLEEGDEIVRQLEAGVYWSTMGHQHYLFSARKP